MVLRDLAAFHATNFNKTDQYEACMWLKKSVGGKDLIPLWTELLKHARFEFPKFWTEERYVFVMSMNYACNRV